MVPTELHPADVPAQVFEEFLKALADAGIAAEVIARLRQTLLVDKRFTEAALKVAVLSEESLP